MGHNWGEKTLQAGFFLFLRGSSGGALRFFSTSFRVWVLLEGGTNWGQEIADDKGPDCSEGPTTPETKEDGGDVEEEDDNSTSASNIGFSSGDVPPVG